MTPPTSLRASFCCLALALGTAACGKVPLAPNGAARSSSDAPTTTLPTGYQVIDLGSLGGGWTVPEALTDAGRVIGSSRTASGEWRAFLYENGVMRELAASRPPLGNTAQAMNSAGLIAGVESGAVLVWDASTNVPRRLDVLITASENRVLGVNERGDILAVLGDGSHGNHTVIWRDGVRQELPGLSSSVWTAGMAWNRRGQVVGGSRVRHLTTHEYFHPFLWENGVMRDLGVLARFTCDDDQGDCGDGQAADINADGVVVGTSTNAVGWPRAFVWENGVMRELNVFPEYVTRAYAINDRGQILGSYTGASQDRGPFVWDHGVAQRVGSLGGSNTFARALGENGEVVGEATTATGEVHGFVWQNGQMTDLGPGSALAINARGDIMGTDGSRGLLWRKMNGPRRMFIEQPPHNQ